MAILTARESQLLVAVLEIGVEVNSASSPEDMIQDNMTWFDMTDLSKHLKVKDADYGKFAQSMGSVMASLARKGLVADSGEPMPGRNRRYFAWYATEAGIRAIAPQIWGVEAHEAEEAAAEDADKEAARLERNRKARERRAAKKAAATN